MAKKPLTVLKNALKRLQKKIRWRVRTFADRPVIVKQNCLWEILVRRMKDVRSMASKTPCAEEKKPFLFAYHAPTAFQIHFCLTISNSNRCWVK